MWFPYFYPTDCVLKGQTEKIPPICQIFMICIEQESTVHEEFS